MVRLGDVVWGTFSAARATHTATPKARGAGAEKGAPGDESSVDPLSPKGAACHTGGQRSEPPHRGPSIGAFPPPPPTDTSDLEVTHKAKRWTSFYVGSLCPAASLYGAQGRLGPCSSTVKCSFIVRTLLQMSTSFCPPPPPLPGASHSPPLWFSPTPPPPISAPLMGPVLQGAHRLWGRAPSKLRGHGNDGRGRTPGGGCRHFEHWGRRSTVTSDSPTTTGMAPRTDLLQETQLTRKTWHCTKVALHGTQSIFMEPPPYPQGSPLWQTPPPRHHTFIRISMAGPPNTALRPLPRQLDACPPPGHSTSVLQLSVCGPCNRPCLHTPGTVRTQQP